MIKKLIKFLKKINLSDEEKYELFSRLMNIDNNTIKIINKQYYRNRLININYLIKKILEDMGIEKYKLITIKINPQSLDNYEKWWESYKELTK